MQQEQKMIPKEALLLPSPTPSKGSIDELRWGTLSSKVHPLPKTLSADMPNIHTYRSDRIVERDLFPSVELRHSVHRSTIAYTVFLVIILVSAEIFLIVKRETPVVLRFVLIPFAVWLVIGLSSFIFRWQSRKLMMTGYLKFYRKSSWVWKVSYGICSSAFAFGTTILILSQESMSPHIHFPKYYNSESQKNHVFLDLLFVFWSITLAILLYLYMRLLMDYLLHNWKRKLPDGVNPTDYRALSEVESEDGGGQFIESKESTRKKFSLSNGEVATFSRQAVTIRYLEKQLKLLMDELLLAQQAGLPVSRSLDERFLRPANTYTMLEYQQVCHEKKLLESECQTYKIRLHSTEQELTGVDRKLESVQGIRQKLEVELANTKEALSKSKAIVKELEILLAVERESTEQARSFIENLPLHKNKHGAQR